MSDVLLPAGTPRLGVVLCPGRTGGVDGLRWLAEPLAAAGAAVAGVTYPPAGRYLEDDVPAARVARATLWQACGSNLPVAVAGHSRGGTVALLAAAGDPGWARVAALSATTDQRRLVAGLRAFAPARYEQMVAAREATPEEDPAYYERTSPLVRAASLTCPVLLLHGTLDLVVPHDHAGWMADALRGAGHAEVELAFVEGAGHFFERGYTGRALDEVAETVVRWTCR